MLWHNLYDSGELSDTLNTSGCQALWYWPSLPEDATKFAANDGLRILFSADIDTCHCHTCHWLYMSPIIYCTLVFEHSVVVAAQQIQEMARMNPQQRLELLKEVGGTKVYEERRKESIKVMNETDTKKAQVWSQCWWTRYTAPCWWLGWAGVGCADLCCALPRDICTRTLRCCTSTGRQEIDKHIRYQSFIIK